MSDKNKYEQKIQTQITEWKKEIETFKAEALAAKENVKIEMNKHIAQIEAKMEESKVKLAELVNASEEKFESLKKEVETIYQSTKSTIYHASKYFHK